MNNSAKIKSKAFALRIIKMYKYLTKNKREFVISNQVLRSGTSIGANLAEAECAISRKDFTSKVYVALKECSETKYWLELLVESGYINPKHFESIYDDCMDILRMLMATTKTLKQEQSNEE